LFGRRNKYRDSYVSLLCFLQQSSDPCVIHGLVVFHLEHDSVRFGIDIFLFRECILHIQTEEQDSNAIHSCHDGFSCQIADKRPVDNGI